MRIRSRKWKKEEMKKEEEEEAEEKKEQEEEEWHKKENEKWIWIRWRENPISRLISTGFLQVEMNYREKKEEQIPSFFATWWT